MKNTKEKKKGKLLGELGRPGPIGATIASFGSLSQQKLAKIEAGLRVSQTDPVSNGQLGFSTRALVQANLPHSNPGDQSVWVRRNGHFSLTIQPGVSVDQKTGKTKEIGIPYGVIPRLILIYLCSEAVRRKERRVVLGDSMKAFMQELGMTSTGGKRGTIVRLKDQMSRLVNAKITFRMDRSEGEAMVNASVAKRAFLWWDERDPDQASLFENEVLLDHDFFDEIVSRPVPLHLGAVHAFKGSSFDLDLYTWLTYRVVSLREPVYIQWADLMHQVGSGYSSVYDFQKRAIKVMGNVKLIWKDLRVEKRRGGFMLYPNEPHVRRKIANG